MEKLKTIALKERTLALLKELKERQKARSFDELIIELVYEKEKVPASMLGSLKGKAKPFTSKERKKIWEDKDR